MRKTLDTLPDIVTNVDSILPDMGRAERLRLLKHDSMSVYYRTEISEDGLVVIRELPTTTARAAIIMPLVGELFRRCGGNASVLDLACSPGYFMFKAAALGIKDITGVDARGDHREQFNMLNSFYKFENIRYNLSDMYDFVEGEISAGRRYDICLLFGFLYHTSTPVELLRGIREICSTALITDTTLCHRGGAGINIFEEDTGWSRASTSRISFMPSLPAVPKMLEAAGFKNTERIMPPPDLKPLNPGGDKIDYYFDQRGVAGITAGINSPAIGLLLSGVTHYAYKLSGRPRPQPRAFFVSYV